MEPNGRPDGILGSEESKHKSMKEIIGKYTSAKIFNDKIEDNDSTVWQIKELINEHEAFAGSKVRIMPHLRSDLCFPIGLTATATDKVTPGIVDDDLGCGVTLAKVKVRELDFEKLDDVIRKCVPSGSKLFKNPHRFADQVDFDRLYCIDHIDQEKAISSIGTLGGRSHFIELDEDDSGNLYVAVLSGSRRLGREVSEYYIESGWQAILKTGRGYPRGYSWVEGDLKESYLNDAAFVTEYAALNRAAILDTLCRNMKWKIQESYSCPHNYIDMESRELIIRKGAVSAKAGEKVIIPVNMRDGIIVGTGKGNPDWNEERWW